VSNVQAELFGELRFSGLWGAGNFEIDGSGSVFVGTIEITGEIYQADPRIRISAEGMRVVFDGAMLRPGTRITVNGEDGSRVIYLVRKYHADEDWYEAEWPD
jgi:hypothetical protein